jgi:hypothetical protein
VSENEQRPAEPEVDDSNPNASGPKHLAGGMGISSERTGPEGSDPADTGVQGTGTHGSAAGSTDGTSSTSRAEVPDVPRVHSEEPAEGPDDDDGDPDGDIRHDPDHDPADSGPSDFSTGIDRTTGEENGAHVPSEHSDPSDNPGHSHG